MKPTYKKEFPYIVECNSNETKVSEVGSFISPSSNMSSKWEYVVCYDLEEYDIEDNLNRVLKTVPLISFEEWQKLPDSKSNFPEKWCIRIDEENLNHLNKYLHENKDKYFGYNDGWKVKLPESGFEDTIYYFYSESKEPSHSSFLKREGFTEITFDEFQKYVLEKDNQNPYMHGSINYERFNYGYPPLGKDKEIIGYKLVKKEYELAVRSLLQKEWFDQHFRNNLKQNGWNFKVSENNLSFHQLLKTAGVLDLWFEPVYKEESMYQPLFNHLHKEHNLILLESQMQEIIDIVNSMQK